MVSKLMGWVSNLDVVLCDILVHYRPEQRGLDSVSSQAIVTLPTPDWAHYAWLAYSLQTVAASSSGLETIYTVPDNLRLWCESVVVQRQSGDNNAYGIVIIQPEGYFTGSPAHDRVIQLVSADADVFWPDPGGRQDVQWTIPGPMLLEPGTIIRLDPDGSGVGETIFRAWVRGRAMKITRARTP